MILYGASANDGVRVRLGVSPALKHRRQAEPSSCGPRMESRIPTIRAVLNRKKVKIATLTKIVIGLQQN